MAGRKVGVGFNAPLVIDGRMTGYDVALGYALMRRIARSGIGQRKGFRWQRCASLVETLRDHRQEFTSRPKSTKQR